MYARIYACVCVFEKCVPHGTQLLFRQHHLSFCCSSKSKSTVKTRFRLIDDAKVGIKKSTDKERLCMRHTLRLMRLYLRQMRRLCAFLFLRKRVFR